MSANKNARMVAIYFDTVDQKKQFERDATRCGLSMNKLALMSLKIGKPAVVKSLRNMQKQTKQVARDVVANTP
jgi:hypothetical protein